LRKNNAFGSGYLNEKMNFFYDLYGTIEITMICRFNRASAFDITDLNSLPIFLFRSGSNHYEGLSFNTGIPGFSFITTINSSTEVDLFPYEIEFGKKYIISFIISSGSRQLKINDVLVASSTQTKYSSGGTQPGVMSELYIAPFAASTIQELRIDGY
jgi:hypothetical protein